MLTETKIKEPEIIQDKSTKEKDEGYRAVIKNRSFLALWLAQIFSQLADRVIFVVFVAFIAHTFSTSTTYQSWLYIAFTIPAVLLTAIAGVFIDKWNKKYTLIATNISRAVLICLLPLFSKTLFGIYLLAFLVSSVTQFFVPAEACSIPMLVRKNQLMSANSLFTATMMGSLIFGFVLGDPLINIFGLSKVNVAIAALFLMSAICLIFVKYKNTDYECSCHKTARDFFEDLKEGFIYIKNHKIIRNSLLKLATLFSLIVTLCILAISISQQLLYPGDPKLGAQKFVYIVAFSGVGMIFGAIIVGKFLKGVKKLFTTFLGFAIVGASLTFLSLIKFVPNELYHRFYDYTFLSIYFESFDLTYRMLYSYITAAFLGFGCAMSAIPVQTILHTLVPEKLRGKIFGVQFTLLSTSSTLPIIIAAYSADIFGVTNVLMVLGLPVALFGVWGILKNSKYIFKRRMA